MANPFVHIELHSTDLAKARPFYEQLFDWKLEDVPMPGGPGTYTLLHTGKEPGGGMMTQMAPGAPSTWLVYVLVDDVDAATAKATSLGGHVLNPPMDIPEIGRFSVLADPAGAVFALYKPLHGAP